MNKISVIVRAYGDRFTSGLLELTLNSIEEQTYRNIQVVLVDNGMDGDMYWLSKMLNNYTFQVTEVDGREDSDHVALNKGLDRADGDYWIIFDSDDLMLPTFLERHVELLEASPEFNAAYCDGWQGEDIETGVPFTYTEDANRDGLNRMLEGETIPFQTLVSREVAEKVRMDESYPCTDDMYMKVKWIEAGARFIKVKDRLWLWRAGHSRMSTEIADKVREAMNLTRRQYGHRPR